MHYCQFRSRKIRVALRYRCHCTPPSATYFEAICDTPHIPRSSSMWPQEYFNSLSTSPSVTKKCYPGPLFFLGLHRTAREFLTYVSSSEYDTIASMEDLTTPIRRVAAQNPQMDSSRLREERQHQEEWKCTAHRPLKIH